MVNNSIPKPRPAALVVPTRDLGGVRLRDVIKLLPAAFVSLVFHAGLILALLFLFTAPMQAGGPPVEKVEQAAIQADGPDNSIVGQNDPLTITDVNNNPNETPDQNLAYKDNNRLADYSVPGLVRPDDPIGVRDGDPNAGPMSIAPPQGLGGPGQGGAIFSTDLPGTVGKLGEKGGYGANLDKIAGTFFGRSGATKEKALRDGGGTKESEAAVALGLAWLARQQLSDGSWSLKGRYPDPGTDDRHIAATALGVLPFLGGGFTHLKAKNHVVNPYDKTVEKALYYLIRKQDKKTGNFGGNMYDHGLATIAMCEAYGLTQDSYLRRPTQMAINYILTAQHDGGGWRYRPGEAGDMSVTGWQVMALKSARMAGIDVPESNFRNAVRFCEACCSKDSDEGYGYLGKNSTPTMTAVGLLCRQYLESWGSKNVRMITGIDKHIMAQQHQPNPANKNMYYYYYATQVVHHFGGKNWETWNDKMRPMLIGMQDKSKVKNNTEDLEGSWSSKGWTWGDAGGRLTQTSLALLTLEVYYRHLPLYYREMGEQRQQLLTGN